ncbi:MAG: glycoside hydrolase family 16 protein [Thermoguttaceae bacterium]|nr:glycoside hydrolase family 16 protein [Thermoguttaceae bacterium]
MLPKLEWWRMAGRTVIGGCVTLLALTTGTWAVAADTSDAAKETKKAQVAFPEIAEESQDVLPTPPAGKTWKLVWHDEFDGTQIDTKKWEMPENPRRDGFWSPHAFELDGQGNLVMKVFQDEKGQFVDGCLRSRGKYEKAKGYFIARMKMHSEVGHWSAFWLYNACEGALGEGSRNGAEIDIMEKPWLDERVNFAIHWDGYGPEHRSAAHEAKVPDVMEGFHTFGLWWSDDAYIFYIDGKEMWRTTADGICEEPLYLKISDEIGNWAGDIKKAKLPDANLIDYVRVYDLSE